MSEQGNDSPPAAPNVPPLPPMPAEAKTSGLAVASLVLGVLGFMSCGLTALVGLILGICGLVSINNSKGRLKGAGMATAGIVISAFMVLILPIMAGMLLPALARARSRAREVRCSSNLKQLGTAMNIYLTKFGADSCFAEPADAFRGDEFVATLFWTDIVQEAMLFACPATSDTGPVNAAGDPVPMPTAWNRAGNLTDEQCSYAGRCKGVTGRYAYRNTSHVFSESLMSSASAMACDKADNHDDGVNVVYFDSHVSFIPDGGPAVGATRRTSSEYEGMELRYMLSDLRHMDDGEK
jgi:prepilin-type processing-associated H-X9-DG protein